MTDSFWDIETSAESSTHHEWQKVVNRKKQRRHEGKSTGSASAPAPNTRKGGANGAPKKAEHRGFKALEEHAEQRRTRREALLQAALDGSSHSAASGAPLQSDSDAEDQEDRHAGAAAADEKKKPQKPKKPKITVAEAASAIDASDLACFLMQISESFADLPDVQLMRFADYFARAFRPVTATQFSFNKLLKESPLAEAVQLPLLYVPKAVCKTATDWLAAIPLSALSDFILWGLNEVMNDAQSQKGGGSGTTTTSMTKVAVLVVLSIALRKRPEALIVKASFVRSSPQFQGQEQVATLAWLYGQVAQGDLVSGMQLWVQNLLPVACGSKMSTPLSRDVTLQFAESILFADFKKSRGVLLSGASRKGKRLVPPTALISLMHASFPDDSAQTKAAERFQGIYPIVKEIALSGPQGSRATKNVAQQLLPMCLDAAGASKDPPALTREAFKLFMWCFTSNIECGKHWEEMHLRKLNGSVKMLSYMCSEWGKVAGRLNQLDLKKTLFVLRVQNRVALEKAKGDVEVGKQLKAADRHCKMLTKRLTRGSVYARAMGMLVAGLGVAYGVYLLNVGVPL